MIRTRHSQSPMTTPSTMTPMPKTPAVRRPLAGVYAAALAAMMQLWWPQAIAQQAPAPVPAPAAVPAPSGKAVLEEAYKKEYAFLVAQKRELSARLQELKRRSASEEASLSQTTDALESKLLDLESESEQLNDLLTEAERSATTRGDDQDAVLATLEQAGVTLKEAGAAAPAGDMALAERVSGMFATAQTLLARDAGVQREKGGFFLADGKKVDGEIIWIGRIAAFGVSPQGSGALAPAGGGAFKLWPASTPDSAEALKQGRQPASLALFLFEDRNKAVEERKSKGFVEYTTSGGSISWVIVAIGVIGVVLSVLRLIFLNKASANTNKVTAQVGQHLEKRDVRAAMQVCEREGDAISKVVAAALRNLDRDPEHLDDIISESILSESNYLDRFGSMIMVIAAVAPLLGLLGTVTGMISTFDVITEYGTGDPKMLSGGISVALITTEYGLWVAIPMLFAGNLLSGWAERIKDDMEKAALRVTNIYRKASA